MLPPRCVGWAAAEVLTLSGGPLLDPPPLPVGVCGVVQCLTPTPRVGGCYCLDSPLSPQPIGMYWGGLGLCTL